MTYQSYIEASLGKFNLSSLELELVLFDNALIPTDDVVIPIVKEAIYKSLSIWMPVYSSISEGGVSESWNIEAVKIYYNALCTELGLENVIDSRSDTIQDKSNFW